MYNNVFKTNLDIRLRELIPSFTNELYYALFEDAQQKKKILFELGVKFNEFLLGLDVIDSVEWKDFVAKLTEIERKLYLDALAFEASDPANKGLYEVYLAYPGFFVLAIYRISHELLKLGVPILPRMLTEYAHGVTGADLHPGATIGESFFIDHATGIVIGETAVIKDRVKIFQGVTLGGLRIDKEDAKIKRHPTIEDDVVIYANATILGGDITIGANSIIGANVWIKESIPPNSIVSYETTVKIRERNYEQYT